MGRWTWLEIGNVKDDDGVMVHRAQSTIRADSSEMSSARRELRVIPKNNKPQARPKVKFRDKIEFFGENNFLFRRMRGSLGFSKRFT